MLRGRFQQLEVYLDGCLYTPKSIFNYKEQSTLEINDNTEIKTNIIDTKVYQAHTNNEKMPYAEELSSLLKTTLTILVEQQQPGVQKRTEEEDALSIANKESKREEEINSFSRDVCPEEQLEEYRKAQWVLVEMADEICRLQGLIKNRGKERIKNIYNNGMVLSQHQTKKQIINSIA